MRLHRSLTHLAPTARPAATRTAATRTAGTRTAGTRTALTGVALALVGAAALAGCASSSTATPAGIPAATPQSVSATPTPSPAPSPSPSAPPATTSAQGTKLTAANICSFLSSAAVESATGLNGITTQVPTYTSDNPYVMCTYQAGAAQAAVLSYEPTLPVSYGMQPDDHGLNGFTLDEPTADMVTFGKAHPGTGRGAPIVSWVYDGRPIHFHFGIATTDATQTIATAKEINSKLPPVTQ